MSLLSIVTFPLHLLASLIRFVLTGLRLPLPALRLSLLNIYARFTGQGQQRPARDPYTVADRWVRALEDETGALCLSRARADAGVGGAGPSSPALRSRYGTMGTGGRVLPDFVLGSYEEALRTCQRELRVGCIVLVSEEHDDTTEFKRKTLTDTHFVEVLHANEFVVWGGDVRDREPWSAAQKLQATTYPFVAFIALQPPRSSAFTGASNNGGGNGGASPALTVLSRHQGLTPTSASALTAHIEQQLLPRVAPFLARLKAQARERELERALRAEQDEAFRRAAERDLEKRLERERREREEQEESERAERERAERERVRREKEERRARWRRGARAAFVGPEREGGVRGETVSSLYAFVDAHLAPEAEDAEGAAGDEREGEGEAGLAELLRECGDADAWWGFKLYTAYPRREIAWIAGVALSNVDGLERGGQLVVEMVSQRDSANESVSGDGDGYDTEESE
ncbi:hypothetical protein EVG20_g3669 [Dentipellis fragilis]|uniref:UAS domain-containing protein n=1 Tax=Dentipellis fragilis TaxID=205917 RepID=A0A4Y9Z0U4_9AGAM|nr:hypothetical protein EVG20_g3669 [Dentipellis fragilis]